jgi:hypothetical protein
MKINRYLYISASLICLLSNDEAMASLSKTSTTSSSMIQEENDVAKRIPRFQNGDLEQLYKLGLHTVLMEESERLTLKQGAMSFKKMSDYEPLRGGAYLFREYYMPEDGSCAKHAMGILPTDAQALLLDKGIATPDPLPVDEHGEPEELSPEQQKEREDAFRCRQQEAAQIREIAHLEIVDIFRDRPNDLPFALCESERYTQLNLALLNIDEFLSMGTIDEHQALREKNNLIETWAKEEETFRLYVQHAFGPGMFTRFEQHLEEQRVRPYVINALSYALGKNLVIWHQIIDQQVVQARPGHHKPQGKFVSIHNYYVNAQWPTLHLVHRGAQFKQGVRAVDGADHFNRLVPINNEEAHRKALIDEAKHLSVRQVSLWKSALLTQYIKAKHSLMKAFMEGNGPFHCALKQQASDFCVVIAQDAPLSKIVSETPLFDREERLYRLILARAYVLAIHHLESKETLDNEQQKKLVSYRRKHEGLRLLGLDLMSFSEEEIALQLLNTYQGASQENDFYKSLKCDPLQHVQSALAFEFYDVIRSLYLNQENLIRKTIEESFLRSCVESTDRATMALKMYGNLYIRPFGSAGDLKVIDQHTNVTDVLRNYCINEKRAGRAYINPDLFSADPFVHLWSYDIDKEPKYAKAPTEAEFVALARSIYKELNIALSENKINKDLALVLKGVAPHQNSKRQLINGEMGSLSRIFSVFSQATQAESGSNPAKVVHQERMRRRIMRLYDLFLAMEETEGRPRIECLADFCNKICMNPEGCLDGVESTVNSLETSFFGGMSASSLEATVSKILIQDRLSFIEAHKKLGLEQESVNGIPRVLEKVLALPWSLGKVPTAMFAAGCGMRPDCTAVCVTNRYLKGERVNGIVFEARTPKKWAALLHEAYLRDVMMSAISKKSEVKRLPSEKAYLEENKNSIRLTSQKLTDFMRNDEKMTAEYNKAFYEMKHSDFIVMDPQHMFKPAFFEYYLKRVGYVLDPNDPEISLWKPEGLARDLVLSKRKKAASLFFRTLVEKREVDLE